jgi:hypothetical protein
VWFTSCGNIVWKKLPIFTDLSSRHATKRVAPVSLRSRKYRSPPCCNYWLHGEEKKCTRLRCPPMAERSYEGSRISVDLLINGNGGHSLIPDIFILVSFSSYYTVRGTAHMCLSRCTALLLPTTDYCIVPLTPYVGHMFPIVITCVLLVQSTISTHENLYLSKIKLFYLSIKNTTGCLLLN